MSLLALPFPVFDPVAVSFGPLVIRWYALAYLAGLLGAWRYVRLLASRPPHPMSGEQVDDILVWATLGVVLGGRLGYVLFYKPGYYLTNPQEIVFLWQGGMAFHGGALGVILATWLFARKNRLSFLAIGDAMVCAVPIGLFLGRLANFVNGELFGRTSDAPWAMVFPHGGPLARHPSQLYQAGLEGLCLLLLLGLLWRSEALRLRRGFLSGAFLTGYAVARMLGELFREPDAHIGFLAFGVTMGQVLSIPMLAAGLWLMMRAKSAP
jgi:phosphatidylglycerol:prolipoprotein diacylglycerol transferase